MSNCLEKKVYIFDVDGTLTPARRSQTEVFSKFFRKWIRGKVVYLASGSDYNKLKEQITEEILEECDGIFSSMGNEFWCRGNSVYANDDIFPEECIEYLNLKIRETKYPYKLGNLHIEKRIGMVNFSVIGRDISYEDRVKYFEWDLTVKERESIAKEFNEKFSYLGYQAKNGGQISLDIQKVGKDKSQIITYLMSKYISPYFIFFGDRTYEGGNDYDIAIMIKRLNLGEVVQVSDDNDCMRKLNERE